MIRKILIAAVAAAAVLSGTAAGTAAAAPQAPRIVPVTYYLQLNVDRNLGIQTERASSARLTPTPTKLRISQRTLGGRQIWKLIANYDPTLCLTGFESSHNVSLLTCSPNALSQAWYPFEQGDGTGVFHLALASSHNTLKYLSTFSPAQPNDLIIVWGAERGVDRSWHVARTNSAHWSHVAGLK